MHIISMRLTHMYTINKFTVKNTIERQNFSRKVKFNFKILSLNLSFSK